MANNSYQLTLMFQDDTSQINTLKGTDTLETLQNHIEKTYGVKKENQTLMTELGDIDTTNPKLSISRLDIPIKSTIMIIGVSEPMNIDNNKNDNKSNKKNDENVNKSNDNQLKSSESIPKLTKSNTKEIAMETDDSDDDINMKKNDNKKNDLKSDKNESNLDKNESKTDKNDKNNNENEKKTMTQEEKDHAFAMSLMQQDASINSPKNEQNNNNNNANNYAILASLMPECNIDVSNYFKDYKLPNNMDKLKYKIIEKNDLINIKKLVWGEFALKKDIDRWFSQGFGFLENPKINNNDKNDEIKEDNDNDIDIDVDNNDKNKGKNDKNKDKNDKTIKNDDKIKDNDDDIDVDVDNNKKTDKNDDKNGKNDKIKKDNDNDIDINDENIDKNKDKNEKNDDKNNKNDEIKVEIDKKEDNSKFEDDFSDISFGLLQLHGGPCGILASAQAYMLKELLFNKKIGCKLVNNSKKPVLPTNDQRIRALINALATILIKCSKNKKKFTWVFAGDINNETYYYNEYSTFDTLTKGIENSLDMLQSRIGVVCFLFSVILSRTIAQIKDDMDDNTITLVLPDLGHCSQEIVNLMITGRCVTNVHDDDKVLHGLTLKGISSGQDIGFLSSSEPYKLLTVGSHYKTPNYPIWVVGSTSHYTTLFSLDFNVGKISKKEKKIQELTKIFKQHDIENSGMLMIDKVEEIYNKLPELKQMGISYIEFQMQVNSDGILLLPKFINGYFNVIMNNTKEWECAICTCLNPFSSNFCQACANQRSNNCKIKYNITEFDNDTIKIPKKFTLYLYNGLKTTKKDRPHVTLLKIQDEQELINLNQFGRSNMDTELTPLIRTKWPYAVVEYDGPFAPKIE